MTPSTSWAISSPNSARSSFEVDVGVLDHVVQERCRDRLLVQTQLGADLRHPERVVDEVFARAPLLALVRSLGEEERVGDELAIELGYVALDLGDQLLDEVLMPF